MKCISKIWWSIIRSFQHSSDARSKKIIRWLVWHYHSLKTYFGLRDRTMIPHLNIKRQEIPYVSCYHQFLHFFLQTTQLSQFWKRAFFILLRAYWSSAYVFVFSQCEAMMHFKSIMQKYFLQLCWVIIDLIAQMCSSYQLHPKRKLIQKWNFDISADAQSQFCGQKFQYSG